MKKNRLSIKAVISLILSLIFLCMPAMVFSMNGNYAVNVRAEDKTETEESTDAETESGSEENSTEDTTENETDTGEDSDTFGDGMESSTENVEETTEDNTEDNTEDGTVSGNEVPEPICNCEDKCGSYEYDRNCPVCVEDYKKCAYKKPNVTISINKPDGWYNDTAIVSFTVTDTAHTGNFETAKIQAKIGQNGSWTDVTEDRKLEISENCTVYVQVTDQKGITYERSRTVKCFDTTKPTLNAAVSDGLLTVQVHDTDSGAKAVYVNGYEFTELTNGTLNVRLQQFDAGYEYFTISAMDNAGNMSEVYKTKNPYYKDPADESDDNPAEQLPVSAEATKQGNATAAVTEHTKTDGEGNTVSENSIAEQKKQAFAEADAAEAAEKSSKDSQESSQSEKGKEFYTIQTANDKVFYLIIDRDGEEELVYFLTEITENDLLNATSDNSDTLPKNSAALESAIPVTDGALPNNNTVQKTEPEENTENAESTEENAEDAQSTEETADPEQENPAASYLLMGGLAAAFIGAAYYFKVVRKKKEDFLDEDDEEDEEEYENEDGDTEDGTDDDFFAGDERETDAAETTKEPKNE